MADDDSLHALRKLRSRNVCRYCARARGRLATMFLHVAALKPFYRTFTSR
jgi:hypothetical protein